MSVQNLSKHHIQNVLVSGEGQKVRERGSCLDEANGKL